ncbi:hypothetical protein SePPVgORF022 [Seal parapoxvirus]|uniref:Uncharacterized protein n=1 Tax=Seal parapoxvirus TaxID=187984 RepID=A0A1Z3GCX2_9POXV|nr:hypothetical protein CGV03_gp022 [Seal parapoxvirus]ASC55607.1 hypothetical protein SePPVgORF022 [Seal parapoxvirus]
MQTCAFTNASMNYPTSRRAAALVRCMMASGFDTWAIEREDLALAALMGFTGMINSNFSERSDYNLFRVASDLSKFSSSCVVLVAPELVAPDLVCTMLQNTTEVTPAMIPYLATHAYCISNMLDMDCLFRLCSYGMHRIRSFSMSQPLAPFVEHVLRRISAHSPLCDLSRIPNAITLCDTDDKIRAFFRNACVSEAQAAIGCRELSHEILLEVHSQYGVLPLNTGLRSVRNFRMIVDLIPDFMDETSVDFTQFLHPSVLRSRAVLDAVLNDLRPHAACSSLYRVLTNVFSLEYIVERAGVIAYACFSNFAQELFEACSVTVSLPLSAFELDIIFEHAEVYVDTLDMRAAMYNVLETLRVTDISAYTNLWRVQPQGCFTVAMYAGSINDILQQCMRMGLTIDALDNLVEIQNAFSDTITQETIAMVVDRGAVDMEWFTAANVDMVLPFIDRVLSVEDVLLPASSDPVDSVFAREEVLTAYALKFRNHPMFFGAVCGSNLPVGLKLRIFERATQGGVFPIPLLSSAIYSFAYAWSPRLLYNYQPTIHPEVERVERVEPAHLLDDVVVRLKGKTRLLLGPRARKCMFVMDLMQRCGGMQSEGSSGHRLVLVDVNGKIAVGVKFEQRKTVLASLAHRIRAVSRDLIMLLQRGIAYRLVTWGAPSDINLPEVGFVRALYSVQFNTLNWGNYVTLDDDLLRYGNAFHRCNQPLVRALAVAHYLYTYVAYFVLVWFYSYKEERLENVLAVLDECLAGGLASRTCDVRTASSQLAVVVTENALVPERSNCCFTQADAFVDALVAGALAKLCEEAQSQQN